MAEADQTAVQRRASWVGLRTLRQRPKLVGETRSGEPVFEVKSVRLVLRDEAGHFSRLTECSKCGREVPGAPVMTPADLDRPAHSVICKDCVRAAGVAPPAQRERRAPKPEAAPAEPVDEVAEPVEAAEDVRLATLEVQLQAAMSRLAELADGDRAESAESRVQEALRQGLADIRAEMSAISERGPAEAPVDEEARTRLDALTQVVQAQQGRLVSLSAVVEEVRTEAQRLAASNQELVRAQGDLERRIDEAASRTGMELAALEQRLRADLADVAQLVGSTTTQGDLERRIDDVLARVGAETAALDQRVRADVTNLSQLVDATPTAVDLDRRIDDAVAQIGAQTAVLEQRLGGNVTNLSQAVEALRGDIEAPLGAPVANGLGMVLQAIHELARSRDEIKAGADLRMEALSAAVEAGASRVRDLEVRMDRAIDRLTAALDDHRRELKELGAATPVPDDDGDLAAPEGSSPSDLLDNLERQLQRAQSRLARLTGGPGEGTGPTAGG